MHIQTVIRKKSEKNSYDIFMQTTKELFKCCEKDLVEK